MFAIGVILTLVGILMAVLEFTGFISAVPGLADISDKVPFVAWIGIAVIGLVVSMFTRRARD